MYARGGGEIFVANLDGAIVEGVLGKEIGREGDGFRRVLIHVFFRGLARIVRRVESAIH